MLLSDDSADTGCVAVGDTFLFSTAPHTALAFPLELAASSNASRAAATEDSARCWLPLLGDCCCLTHPIPWLHFLPGPHAEDRAVQRLLGCTRLPHL